MPEASKHLTIITPITLVFPSVSGVVWFYRIQIERIALSVYLGSGLSVMKTTKTLLPIVIFPFSKCFTIVLAVDCTISAESCGQMPVDICRRQ